MPVRSKCGGGGIGSVAAGDGIALPLLSVNGVDLPLLHPPLLLHWLHARELADLLAACVRPEQPSLGALSLPASQQQQGQGQQQQQGSVMAHDDGVAAVRPHATAADKQTLGTAGGDADGPLLGSTSLQYPSLGQQHASPAAAANAAAEQVGGGGVGRRRLGMVGKPVADKSGFQLSRGVCHSLTQIPHLVRLER